jgi:hypothetical protein
MASSSSCSLIAGALATPAAAALPSSIQGLLSGSRRFAGLAGKGAGFCCIVWKSEVGRRFQSPLFLSRIGGAARSSLSGAATTSKFLLFPREIFFSCLFPSFEVGVSENSSSRMWFVDGKGG